QRGVVYHQRARLEAMRYDFGSRVHGTVVQVMLLVYQQRHDNQHNVALANARRRVSSSRKQLMPYGSRNALLQPRLFLDMRLSGVDSANHVLSNIAPNHAQPTTRKLSRQRQP